ncbi:MAG: hypothetical protein U0Q04_09400 [Microbacterium sp.]
MKNKLSQAVAASIVAVGLLVRSPRRRAGVYADRPHHDHHHDHRWRNDDFGGFVGGTDVTFTLVGERGQRLLAIVKLAVNSKTAVAGGWVRQRFGHRRQPERGVQASATGARASSEAGGSSTPSTGGDSDSLLGIWIGGGAPVLAGATIAVGASVRRGRQQADA